MAQMKNITIALLLGAGLPFPRAAAAAISAPFSAESVASAHALIASAADLKAGYENAPKSFCRTVKSKNAYASHGEATRALEESRRHIQRRYPTGLAAVIADPADPSSYFYKLDILPSITNECPVLVESANTPYYAGYAEAVNAMSRGLLEAFEGRPRPVSVDTFVFCMADRRCGYSFSLLY